MSNRIEDVHEYLIQHRSELDSEGKKNYQNRIKRLIRINQTAPYVTIHWSHMSQPITPGGIENDKRMQGVWDDATGFRQNYETVSRDRLFRFIRDGRVGTLVDSPSIAEKAASRDEARSRGERSYQVLFDAVDVRNWRRFTKGARKGQFAEVLLAEPGYYEKPRYRKYWIEDTENAEFQWQVYEALDKNPVLKEEFEVTPLAGDEYQGQGELKEIPFVLWGDGPEDSLIADVYQLDIGLMNHMSVRQNIIYNQGFQRIVMIGVDKEEVKKMNEYSVTLVKNPDASIQNIESGDPVAAGEEIAMLMRQIDRRGKFEFNQLSDDTRQTQSADSKAKDLVTRQAIYNATVDHQEDVEGQILRLHALFEGLSEEAASQMSISIGRDFGLDDAEAELTKQSVVFTNAKQLNVDPLCKEILKTQALTLDYVPGENEQGKPETADDVRARMMKAIDEAQPVQPVTFSSPLQGGLFDSLT